MTKNNSKTAATVTAVEYSAARTWLNEQVEAAREEQRVTAPPTRQSITEAISAAIDNLASAFTELDLRVRGDNGQLYPVCDQTGEPRLPAGTEGMGVEMVNTLTFIQEQVVGGLTWKLESMLEQNVLKQGQQREQVAWARKAVDEGRAPEGLLEARAGFLDQLEYQHALIEAAFDAACEAHAANTGKPFMTKAEREAEKIQARRRARMAGTPATASKADRFRNS